MEKNQLLLGICLGGMLLGGCSSKPDAGDVEAGLKESWGPCKLVKPTSFKKTNGVDRGEKYQMAISYKLEVVNDIAEEDIWTTKVPKEITPTATNHLEWIEQQQELNAPRYAAIQRVEKFYAENCPGPMSRYFQKLFGANQESGFGRPLKKGETVDVSTEYTMIKSEKGWIIE